jgi:Putative rhamnosyl transferase
MRHYVLTTSRRGPEYPLDANARRIALCRGITARSLAAQDCEFTWIVYVHPEDPLLDERLDAFCSAGHPVVAVGDNVDVASVIDWSDDVLSTRVDDDDGWAVNAFARLHHALRRRPSARTGFMFPVGYRVNDGLCERIVHRRNAWSSLFAPRGDQAHIRMVKHNHIYRFATVRSIDMDPAWLWVRHQDAETRFRRANEPITPALRAIYPVDWSLIS